MGFYVKNATPSPIWVVFGEEWQPGCGDQGGWSKTGWYQVQPAETAKLKTGWVGGSCYLYYAEDDAGHVWSGAYRTSVQQQAFQNCWNVNYPGGRIIGLDVVCVDWDIMDHTVNFVL
jgi:hypothetical protein